MVEDGKVMMGKCEGAGTTGLMQVIDKLLSADKKCSHGSSVGGKPLFLKRDIEAALYSQEPQEPSLKNHMGWMKGTKPGHGISPYG